MSETVSNVTIGEDDICFEIGYRGMLDIIVREYLAEGSVGCLNLLLKIVADDLESYIDAKYDKYFHDLTSKEKEILAQNCERLIDVTNDFVQGLL